MAWKHQVTGWAVVGPSSWSNTNAVTQFWFGLSSSTGRSGPGWNWINPVPRSLISPSSAVRTSTPLICR